MSEEEDNDDENSPTTAKRFANVKRNDSLAHVLKDRSLRSDFNDKNTSSVDERKNECEMIETKKSERKLSLRSKAEDLKARNILHPKTAAELSEENEEKKRYLIRKLSFRPSVQGKKFSLY